MNNVYKICFVIGVFYAIYLIIVLLNSNNIIKSKCAYNSLIDKMDDMTSNEEEEESFYIHLISNVTSPISYKENTVANFTTKLAAKIQLNSDWEVGLSEISYTKSWYNMVEEELISAFGFPSGGLIGSKKNCYIRAGYYNNINQLVTEINSRMKCLEKDTFFAERIQLSPQLRYDEITNRVYVRPGYGFTGTKEKDKIFPYFYGEVETLLGMRTNETENYFSNFYDPINDVMIDETELKLNKLINYEAIKQDPGYNMFVPTASTDNNSFIEEYESPFPVQFNVTDMHLLVYCSIINPVFVGDTYTKLLRQVEIPRDVKFGEQVVIRYLEPFYYPLVSQEIDMIEIDIKDDSGQRVPFDFGRSSLTLHFRKKRHNDIKSLRKLLR